ncbi:MAG: DUF3084 domain-containing protein [Selenomonadaceae bacterium]|nr:DUF3084 domain-containing protein [Selenomonadaceae bacterium]MBQ3451412.1 DUF3084 domain-containing protein [Selenomonadaceae bacterium]MBQ4403794.1 DUF3084 domain-containing protein [Selenomonadaceae bacterium]MBQ6131753.1 DUF3084 domain-containing protein [Selenomonadaceae bacterium]MBQ7492834.1 DUF3084 domain-containing protein [Selenomonadaceae bacterium]
MEGIYLILVMIVTGGAIAFIGDKLGTKIGKKRLSIFGLRPRHTSMIVTVATGCFITLASIGFMLLISQNVRTALFGMDELRHTMDATLSELDEATENLFKAQTEFERANENLRMSKEEIVALKSEQEELRAESDRLKEGNEQLEATNSELAAQNENLSGTNAALEADNKKLGEFNVTLTADNDKLSADNDKLSSDNDKLSADNSELEERNNRLREGLIAIREGDITLRAGEILGSGIIKGGRTAEEISADINAIAEQATRNIVERFGGDENTSVWIYQPELQRVIEEIESSRRDMVLRISAAGNLVRGEPVRSRLELYPNELIFKKGELILSKTYELGDVEPEIILQDFLTEINRLAIEKGILSDPLTGSVGRMDGTQLYEVLDSLIDAKGKIQLTATAREETDSQGPLRLNIKMEQR